MSKADKMFEELGYKKYINDEYSISYEKKDYLLVFEKKELTIEKAFYNPELNSYTAKEITMQELKTINQKCKELGWIE